MDTQQQLVWEHGETGLCAVVLGAFDANRRPKALFISLNRPDCLMTQAETLISRLGNYRFCGAIAYLPNGDTKVASEPDAEGAFLMAHALEKFDAWVAEQLTAMNDPLERAYFLRDPRTN